MASLAYVVINFQRYFPSISKRAVSVEEAGPFELLIKTNDGDKYIYYDLNNSIRQLPRDSRNLTEEECRREFGKRLQRTMHIKGITQDDLSRETNISRRLISDYITGRRTPGFYNVDKIAKAIGCSADTFRYI